MKKTLLTTLLLAAFHGMVSAADEGQATVSFNDVMPPLINDSGASTITFVSSTNGQWVNWPKEPNSYSTPGFLAPANFAKDVGIIGLQEEGWKFFMGNATNSNSGDVSSVTGNGFTFLGRYGYSGEAVTATTSVARLLTENDASELTSFSVNFAVNHTWNEASSGTASNIYVGLWSYNTTTHQAALLARTSYNAHNDTSLKTLTADGLSLGADDVVIVSWFNQSGGHTNEVSNVSFSAEGQAAVPEPATATLSLLALAGLAARRRRR